MKKLDDESYGMLKVATIAPVPFLEDRGAPIRVYEIVSNLTELGVNITTFTYHLGREVEGLRIVRIPRIPWYKRTAAGPTYHKVYLDALLFLRSSASLMTENFDIIHTYLHEGAAIGLGLRGIKRKPMVAEVQGSLTGEMLAYNFLKKGSLGYRWWRWVENFLNSRMDAIVVGSYNTRKTMIEDLGVDEEKVFLVQDGVNIDLFRPGYDNKALRDRLGIPSDNKVVVYLGLLTRHQGTDHLLQAASLLLDELKDVHFLIMGFPNVDRYRAIARDLGLSKKVTFTGKMPYTEAPKYLALGDIAVAPKILRSGEGNSKICNYMASGLPVVTFDYENNREILGDLGFYTRPEDPASLAGAMKKLLSDERRRKALSSKLREKAVKEYSWRGSARKILDIYDWVKGST